MQVYRRRRYDNDIRKLKYIIYTCKTAFDDFILLLTIIVAILGFIIWTCIFVSLAFKK